MALNDRNVTVENAEIMFRNFKGVGGQYNREGDRNFALRLNPDLADQMAGDGWNVKVLPAREEGDEVRAFVKVKVSYNERARPPRVVLITSGGRTTLDEETVGILDDVEIASVDLIVSPYDWDVNGKQGVTAYLKSIYVTAVEDALEQKYNQLEDKTPRRIPRVYEEEDAQAASWTSHKR